VGLTVRDGEAGDAARVRDLAADTWPDRAVGDYVGDAYPRWVREAADRDDRRVLVAASDGEAVAVMRGCLLSEWEGWAAGLRVVHDHRGEGVGERLTRATLSWLRDAGAAVCRNLVHGWNAPSLGLSRATGFDPVTEFRFAEPTPDADVDPALPVGTDPDAGWTWWTGSAARAHLAGLALDPEETWALSDLTRERLRAAADEGRLLVVGDDRTRGLALRTRVTTDGGEARVAEYGVGAWADDRAAGALLDAVARDAARVDADRARVLVPETVGTVSDAASAGAGLADDPAFVLAAALSGGEAQGT
jgi:GNAT superfamily N-acetyltransferase